MGRNPVWVLSWKDNSKCGAVTLIHRAGRRMRLVFPRAFIAKSFWRCFTPFAPSDGLFWNQYFIFFYKGKHNWAGTAQLMEGPLTGTLYFPGFIDLNQLCLISIYVLDFKKMLMKLYPWKGGLEPTKEYCKQMRFLPVGWLQHVFFGLFYLLLFSFNVFRSL